MKLLGVAIWVEGLKMFRSKVFWGTIFFFAFIASIMGILMYVFQNPDLLGRSETLSAKASFIEETNWNGFFSLLLQLVLTLGTIGYGFVASWIYGREFADKTIKDILALPVSRTKIVLAKFFTVIVWSIILTLILLIFAILIGSIVGIPEWSTQLFMNFLKIFITTAFYNILLSSFVAWFATIGRGYILPIAYTIFTLVVTQFAAIGIPKLTIYIPWAYPALYSGIVSKVAPQPNIVSTFIFWGFILIGLFGTIYKWNNSDHK